MLGPSLLAGALVLGGVGPLVAALSDLQRQHPEIPEVEYETRIGAITQWFLSQAGLAVSKGRPHPAEPGRTP